MRGSAACSGARPIGHGRGPSGERPGPGRARQPAAGDQRHQQPAARGGRARPEACSRGDRSAADPRQPRHGRSRRTVRTGPRPADGQLVRSTPAGSRHSDRLRHAPRSDAHPAGGRRANGPAGGPAPAGARGSPCRGRIEPGGRALAAAARQRPDVLLTDVGMPGVSGPELAQRLREDAPLLPVVLMSGHTVLEPTEPLVEDALFPPKPFMQDELLDAIASVLALRTEPG
ncbi:MAG: response regulator [Proteobacteria bacterium]|nr:response regulator [Pseudomonadota bacterium]MCP4918149.1 response regulator [Pseudomonadota bacterium]